MIYKDLGALSTRPLLAVHIILNRQGLIRPIGFDLFQKLARGRRIGLPDRRGCPWRSRAPGASRAAPRLRDYGTGRLCAEA